MPGTGGKRRTIGSPVPGREQAILHFDSEAIMDIIIRRVCVSLPSAGIVIAALLIVAFFDSGYV